MDADFVNVADVEVGVEGFVGNERGRAGVGEFKRHGQFVAEGDTMAKGEVEGPEFFGGFVAAGGERHDNGVSGGFDGFKIPCA